MRGTAISSRWSSLNERPTSLTPLQPSPTIQSPFDLGYTMHIAPTHSGALSIWVVVGRGGERGQAPSKEGRHHNQGLAAVGQSVSQSLVRWLTFTRGYTCQADSTYKKRRRALKTSDSALRNQSRALLQ
jgi:hypothetical protein